MAFRQYDVVRALDLRPDQQEAIRGIEAECFGFRFGPGGPGPGGPPRGRPETTFAVAVEKILAVLTDEQKAKWAEMTGRRFEGAPFFPGPPRPFGPPPR